MEETTENLDSTNEEVQVDTEETTETVDVSKVLETNKKLFERAKKAELELKTFKQKPIIKGEEQLRPSDILKSPEFRLHREGYDEDVIELIMNNGGPKILENKNSPITLGIERLREQREAEKAAAQTSNNVGMTEVEKKYTPEQLKEMPLKDLEKILPHA